MTGPAVLRAWMATHNRRSADLAEELGVSVSYVSKLRRGRLVPSRTTAIALEHVSKGAVSAAAWVPTAEDRAAA